MKLCSTQTQKLLPKGRWNLQQKTEANTKARLTKKSRKENTRKLENSQYIKNVTRVVKLLKLKSYDKMGVVMTKSVEPHLHVVETGKESRCNQCHLCQWWTHYLQSLSQMHHNTYLNHRWIKHTWLGKLTLIINHLGNVKYNKCWKDSQLSFAEACRGFCKNRPRAWLNEIFLCITLDLVEFPS